MDAFVPGADDRMTALPEPMAALRQVPGWQHANVRLEVLAGGLTNRTYRVIRGDDEFVLRLAAADESGAGINRQRELAVHAAAARAGIAPPLLHADARQGLLLYRYLPGRVWTAADLDDPARLDMVATLLRLVHELPLSGHALDAGAVGARYLQGLRGAGQLHDQGRAVARWLANSGPVAELRCCHNDVVAGNLVEASSLMLLDWEYAADNDPLFDLASLIAFHELDAAATQRLLGAYLGSVGPEAFERLERQLLVYRALSWLWFANRERRQPEAERRRYMRRLYDPLRSALSR